MRAWLAFLCLSCISSSYAVKVHRQPGCLDAAKWLADFPNSPEADFRTFSQGDQDGVLKSLFDFKNLGVTNRGFVEVGFPEDTISTSYGNGHELMTGMMFQPLLLLDIAHDNPLFNLHKHRVTPENIVGLFDQYNVLKEPDFVSIDVDSVDIWLFMAVTSKYRPRVMTVEFNSGRKIDDFSAMRPDTKYVWNNDDLYGSSLASIYLAAQQRGYTMVYATRICDTFLIRNDLICEGTAPPLDAFKNRTDDHWFPKYVGQQGPKESILMDFKSWLEEHPDA